MRYVTLRRLQQTVLRRNRVGKELHEKHEQSCFAYQTFAFWCSRCLRRRAFYRCWRQTMAEKSDTEPRLLLFTETKLNNISKSKPFLLIFTVFCVHSLQRFVGSYQFRHLHKLNQNDQYKMHWESTDLPFPLATVNINCSIRAKCWLR